MTPSLVSCIVPVFNGELYLREALDSILEQTYRPLEVIVVDDGSTDGTRKIATSFGSRVQYVQQENRGYSEAKNTGLRVARGGFIAFLDADDLWRPEKLERQLFRLRERPEIDLCFSRFQSFWMPELADEERRYKDDCLSQPSSAWSICTLLTHRTMFERFGNFHDGTRALENMTWFLRAEANGAVIDVMPDVLMYRRFNLESITRRGRSQFFDAMLPIVKEWRDYQRRKSQK